MADIVSCPNFLMLRAASEQLRAADSLKTVAESAKRFHAEVQVGCDVARQVMDEAIDRTSGVLARSIAEWQRSHDALESGDLAQMIAERDKLLKAMTDQCRRCAGYSPFDPDPCCREREASGG